MPPKTKETKALTADEVVVLRAFMADTQSRIHKLREVLDLLTISKKVKSWVLEHLEDITNTIFQIQNMLV